MKQPDLSGNSPLCLSRLLARQWDQPLQAEELGLILTEQLAAPLATELALAHPETAVKRGVRCGTAGTALGTFGDLFGHAAPPLELVIMTKDYARFLSEDPQGALPPEIGRVLYFAAIALASCRCGQRITALEDQGLRHGFAWVLAQPWLGESLRELVQEAQDALD